MSTRTVTVAIAAALAHGAVAERFFWNKVNDLSVADNWVGAAPASDANWVDFPACATQAVLSVSVDSVTSVGAFVFPLEGDISFGPDGALEIAGGVDTADAAAAASWRCKEAQETDYHCSANWNVGAPDGPVAAMPPCFLDEAALPGDGSVSLHLGRAAVVRTIGNAVGDRLVHPISGCASQPRADCGIGGVEDFVSDRPNELSGVSPILPTTSQFSTFCRSTGEAACSLTCSNSCPHFETNDAMLNEDLRLVSLAQRTKVFDTATELYTAVSAHAAAAAPGAWATSDSTRANQINVPVERSTQGCAGRPGFPAGTTGTALVNQLNAVFDGVGGDGPSDPGQPNFVFCATTVSGCNVRCRYSVPTNTSNIGKFAFAAFLEEGLRMHFEGNSLPTGAAVDRTPVPVGAVTVSLQDASFDFITANYVAINNDIVNTQLVAMGTVGLAADSGDASALLGRVQPFLPYIVGGTPTITPGGDNNFVITGLEVGWSATAAGAPDIDMARFGAVLADGLVAGYVEGLVVSSLADLHSVTTTTTTTTTVTVITSTADPAGASEASKDAGLPLVPIAAGAGGLLLIIIVVACWVTSGGSDEGKADPREVVAFSNPAYENPQAMDGQSMNGNPVEDENDGMYDEPAFEPSAAATYGQTGTGDAGAGYLEVDEIDDDDDDDDVDDDDEEEEEEADE
jgi:hypothetical protein